MVTVIHLNTDDDEEEEEDPFHDAVLARRMRLNEDQTNKLFDKLPPRDEYIGETFVTRLTRTNVSCGPVMVCYLV